MVLQANKLDWVKKRDGRVVPFLKDKIIQAVYKALKSTGRDDLLLAQEMAEAVTLYLERNSQGKIPDIETIQDSVERVLVEMKLFETAKAYILYRDKRARLRDAMHQTPAGRPPEPILGQDGFRWDRERVVRALAEELKITRMLAERVADIVEENSLEARRRKIPPDQLDFSIN